MSKLRVCPGTTQYSPAVSFLCFGYAEAQKAPRYSPVLWYCEAEHYALKKSPGLSRKMKKVLLPSISIKISVLNNGSCPKKLS